MDDEVDRTVPEDLERNSCSVPDHIVDVDVPHEQQSCRLISSTAGTDDGLARKLEVSALSFP